MAVFFDEFESTGGMDIVVDFKISSWNYYGKPRWMSGKTFPIIADILLKFFLSGAP